MKRYILVILICSLLWNTGTSQGLINNTSGILFHGFVMDSGTETPLSGTQIYINRTFFSVSNNQGEFAFFVSRSDTVAFRRLGYKPTTFYISDTLSGREFIAGVYMHTDTLMIGEVVIVPRLTNLRSEILSPGPPDNTETENAKFNLAVSAYQGRVSQGRMGDPVTNYNILRERQKYKAYSKGQIPPDQIIGISPLMLIPAAYLLLNGLPEKPPPLQPRLTEQEISLIHKKYLEMLNQRK